MKNRKAWSKGRGIRRRRRSGARGPRSSPRPQGGYQPPLGRETLVGMHSLPRVLGMLGLGIR